MASVGKIKCRFCKNERARPDKEARIVLTNAITGNKVFITFYVCSVCHKRWKEGKLKLKLKGMTVQPDVPGWTLLSCHACTSTQPSIAYNGKCQILYLCQECYANPGKKVELMMLFADSVKEHECDIFEFTSIVADEIIAKKTTKWIQDYKLRHAVESVLDLYWQIDKELTIVEENNNEIL